MSKLVQIGTVTLATLTGNGAFHFSIQVGNGTTTSFYAALAIAALTGMIFKNFENLLDLAEEELLDKEEVESSDC